MPRPSVADGNLRKHSPPFGGARNTKTIKFPTDREIFVPFVKENQNPPPIKLLRGKTSLNKPQGATRHLPVPLWGSAQMVFRGVPAIRIELRAARTSLGAYVRLLSTRLHGMLWARAPGHLRPTPRASSHFSPNLKSRFSLG